MASGTPRSSIRPPARSMHSRVPSPTRRRIRSASRASGTCNSGVSVRDGIRGGKYRFDRFVGLSSTANDLNAAMSSGAFDDAYYSSGGTGGALYVCGSSTGICEPTDAVEDHHRGRHLFSRDCRTTPRERQRERRMLAPTVFKNGSTENLYVSVRSNGAARRRGGCTAPATVASTRTTSRPHRSGPRPTSLPQSTRPAVPVAS